MPNSTQPLVTVGIPIYNGLQYVDRIIGAVLGQDYPNIEVLVVDDVSTDGTWEKLQHWAADPRVRLTRNEQNSGGPGLGTGTILNEAAGEFVTIVEQDDYIPPFYISKMVELQQDCGCDVVKYGEVGCDDADVDELFADGEKAAKFTLPEYKKPTILGAEKIAEALARRDIGVGNYAGHMLDTRTTLFRTDIFKTELAQEFVTENGLSALTAVPAYLLGREGGGVP